MNLVWLLRVSMVLIALLTCMVYIIGSSLVQFEDSLLVELQSTMRHAMQESSSSDDDDDIAQHKTVVGLSKKRARNAIRKIRGNQMATVNKTRSGFKNRCFAFWFGPSMTGARKRGFDSLKANMEADGDVALELVTTEKLLSYQVPEWPLHPAALLRPGLSAAHLSDYLRAYFMHHCITMVAATMM